MAELEAMNVEVEPVHPESIEQIAPSLTAAVSRGADRVVLAGGDGLLHRALPTLSALSVDIGLVPVGTGNDFARALGLGSGIKHRRRRSLRDALRRALGPTRLIDLLDVSGRTVASVATAGFSGSVNRTANEMRLPLGAQKYTLATLLESTRLRPMPMRMLLDDAELIEREVAFVAIANTRFFGGGMAICPDADPTDGCLDIVIVDPLPAAKLLLLLPLVFSGRHVRHPAVSVHRAQHVDVAVGQPFWGDGEPLEIREGTIRCLPDAAKIAGCAVPVPALRCDGE